MKVKITGCSNPNWWYHDKIGNEYEVELRYYMIPDDEEKDDYQLINSPCLITKSDCEIIEP